ncbi:hypothetical protein [Nocardioides zeae]
MLKFADVDLFLRAASAAYSSTLLALERAEPALATAVLTTTAARGDLAAAARHALRDRPWVPLPQVAAEVRVVDDVEEVCRLVHRLATVLDSGGAHDLAPRVRSDVRRLRDAGERRFSQVREGCVYAAASAGSTAVFLDVVDHHAAAAVEVDRLVGELAGAMLLTTRDAAVAA